MTQIVHPQKQLTEQNASPEGETEKQYSGNV